MPYDTAIRLDASRAVRTDEGFLRVPARITRVGILEYVRDGRIVRELRRPEQVFAPDSLESLAGVPITVGHSARYVTARDVAAHAVGFVGADVRRDGQFVEATLTIWREDAVRDVESRKLAETSAGYRAGFGPAGAWQGQSYDVDQTGIRYNHVALLPKGHGRAGPDVAIRLDGHDLITLLRERLGALGLPDAELATGLGLPDAEGVRMLLDGALGTPSEALLTRAAGMVHLPVSDLISMAPRAPEPEPQVSRMKRSIILNGVAYTVEVPDEQVPSFDVALAEADRVRTDAADAAAQLAEVTADRDALRVRLDAAEALQAVAARDAAVAQARGVFPAVAGDSVRDVHVATLTHLGHGDAIRTDASDAEVGAMFALALKTAQAAPTPTAPAPAPQASDVRTDAAGADAARERMLERSRNAWKGAAN